ncbi:MAG TPA: sugar transferase [Melioribacteraceae bacterium]|nr:sugar transferase [Melioribacteraceae bacterium]
MLIKLITDLLIYTLSFKLIETIKLGEVQVYSAYTPYHAIILLTVLFSSLITGKYGITSKRKVIEGAQPIFRSLILSIGIITIYFNLVADSFPSRLVISGTFLLGFSIELFIRIIKFGLIFENPFKIKFNFSPGLFVSEFLLILFIIVITYFTYSSVRIEYKTYSTAFLLIFWIASSVFTHHFEAHRSSLNYWYFIWRRIKGYIIFIAFVSFMVYILIPENLSTIYPLYIALIFSIHAVIINSIYYLYRSQSRTDEPATKFLKATSLLDEPMMRSNGNYPAKYGIKGNPFNHYLSEQLLTVYLKKHKEIYNFLEEHLDFLTFDVRNSYMIKSSDVFNIEVMPENKLEFYMNLRELNDIQRINKYLKKVNQKLIDGGVFVGAVEPLSLRRERFFKKYPFYFAYIFYFFDFIWKRFFPKMPFLKNIYFGLTKGKNRALSLPEIIGRIYFCGFDLINFKQIGNLVYLIAVKKREPSQDTNPSYGPFIKLKRIGLHGKTFYVYKFRTMYPYSEYLQNFVFEKANLKEGGKFKDDFRITSWGRVLRRFWLDEFPMFINFFKGQLKLVGVRPLSSHYFSLYPEDLKKRRIKYKPGLVPPYYADLPKTIDEIAASESKYLDSYEKNPLFTDIRYFFKAWYNILVRKARSG